MLRRYLGREFPTNTIVWLERVHCKGSASIHIVKLPDDHNTRNKVGDRWTIQTCHLTNDLGKYNRIATNVVVSTKEEMVEFHALSEPVMGRTLVIKDFTEIHMKNNGKKRRQRKETLKLLKKAYGK